MWPFRGQLKADFNLGFTSAFPHCRLPLVFFFVCFFLIDAFILSLVSWGEMETKARWFHQRQPSVVSLNYHKQLYVSRDMQCTLTHTHTFRIFGLWGVKCDIWARAAPAIFMMQRSSDKCLLRHCIEHLFHFKHLVIRIWFSVSFFSSLNAVVLVLNWVVWQKKNNTRWKEDYEEVINIHYAKNKYCKQSHWGFYLLLHFFVF